MVWCRSSFVLCVEVLVGAGDGSLEQRVDLSWGENSAAGGPQVVDDVEWSACRVQDGSETLTGAVGEAAEEVDQGQQQAHDQVAEHHVEQQLLVGPPGTSGAAVKIGGTGHLQQLMEAGAGRVHLVLECLAVDDGHLSDSIGLHLPGVRSAWRMAHRAQRQQMNAPGVWPSSTRCSHGCPQHPQRGRGSDVPVRCGGGHDSGGVGVSAVATACRVSLTSR